MMTTRGRKIRSTTVPWMNSEQFKKVYSYLYSDNLSKKRWAVDEVSVWNTRCHPSLPTAIELTVSLVRATVHDMLYQVDKTFCQEEDIKMLYSMALIRFVNLTVEHHQKGPNKIGLSYLANKLNIPSWIVDLRNEATHSFCPSLSMLRMGTDFALDYLEKIFWAQEAANVKTKTNPPSEREAEIVNLLNQYKNLQFQKAENPGLRRSLGKDMKDVLKKIGRIILRDGGEFIDVLVQAGNFISVEDIKKLLLMSSPFIQQKNCLILPIQIQVFWNPLLRKIHFKDLMPMFLEKLILAQENCRIKICQKTAVAWALQILLGVNASSLLSNCFQKKGLLLNYRCLVYAAMKAVNPWSAQLLLSITSQMKEKGNFDWLFRFLALRQGQFLDNEEISKRKRNPDEQIIFTIEDVEEELNAKKMKTQKEENIWFEPSVTMDFTNEPIGALLLPENQDDDIKENSEPISLEPSVDDIFIVLNKNDGEGTVEEAVTHDINTFPVTTIPENFDMVYRRRPKQ